MSTRNLAAFTGAGYTKGSKIKFVLWYVVENLVFRSWWCPSSLRVALLRRFGATVGEGTQIRANVHIHIPWYLWIGDNCWIGDNVYVINALPVTIGSNVCLSQEVALLSGGHDPRSPALEFSHGPIVVKDGAWVAMRTIVLRDVVIGEDAVIGANCVISRSVADNGTVRSQERW